MIKSCVSFIVFLGNQCVLIGDFQCSVSRLLRFRGLGVLQHGKYLKIIWVLAKKKKKSSTEVVAGAFFYLQGALVRQEAIFCRSGFTVD